MVVHIRTRTCFIISHGRFWCTIQHVLAKRDLSLQKLWVEDFQVTFMNDIGENCLNESCGVCTVPLEDWQKRRPGPLWQPVVIPSDEFWMLRRNWMILTTTVVEERRRYWSRVGKVCVVSLHMYCWYEAPPRLSQRWKQWRIKAYNWNGMLI